MTPRVLSIAAPLFAYTTLFLVVCGIYRERAKLDRWTLIVGLCALVASSAFRRFEHLLFFDEDIYSNIASNLAHAPVAQLTLFGSTGEPRVSTYYKEPAGYPTLLSLVFLFTGTSELAAFIVARFLFALAVMAVYQLAREVLKTAPQSIIAALLFAGTPVVFAYSGSAGTDLPAALFSCLGMWGIAAGNGMLAAAGLAYAAQTRMELIVLMPMILGVRTIPLRWKAAGFGLVVGQIFHISWVLSVAPQLAKVEHVAAAFSLHYAPRNLLTSFKYLFSPTAFPTMIVVCAAFALLWRKSRRAPHRTLLLLWMGSLFGVYLCFYAGGFDLNPRYSIQIVVPLIILAVMSVPQRQTTPSAPIRNGDYYLWSQPPPLGKEGTTVALASPPFQGGEAATINNNPRSLLEQTGWFAALLLSLGVANIRPFTLPDYVQTLVADHQTALAFAKNFSRDTLVVTTEPEEFLNMDRGLSAINAIYASEEPARLRDVARNFKTVIYYAGVRTNQEGSPEQAADRWVKSNFQLHLIDSRQIRGMRIAYYELLL